MSRLRTLGRDRRMWIAAILLLALAGHIVYHYGPRARAAAPDSDDLPGRVLAGGGYDVMVWLPFPHQNLGALRRGGTDFGTLLGAAAELSGTRPPAVPRFGPFALPPSKELLLAADFKGEGRGGRFLLAARVYPVLATVARAAGQVASNPWLGGGVVQLEDRRVEIRWQGTLWTITSPPAVEQPIPVAEQGETLPAMLAGLRLAQPAGVLPQGLYSLTGMKDAGRSGVRFALLGEGGNFPVPEGGDPSALTTEPISVLAVTGWAEPRAWLLFDHGGAFLSPTGDDLGAGMLLAALLGEDGYQGKASGWEVQASGEQNFRRAGFLVPDLVRLLDAWDAPRLRLALAADPAAALNALGEVENGLRVLSLPGEENRPLRRLVALRRLAAPTARYSHLRLLSARGPDRFEMVLHR